MGRFSLEESAFCLEGTVKEGKCLVGSWIWDELRELGMEREWPERRQEG